MHVDNKMEKFVINNFLKHLILDCGLKKEFIEEMIAYAKQQQVSFITYLIQTKKDRFFLFSSAFSKRIFSRIY